MSLTDRDRLKVCRQSSRHFVTQLNLELSYGFVNFNNFGIFPFLSFYLLFRRFIALDDIRHTKRSRTVVSGGVISSNDTWDLFEFVTSPVWTEQMRCNLSSGLLSDTAYIQWAGICNRMLSSVLYTLNNTYQYHIKTSSIL